MVVVGNAGEHLCSRGWGIARLHTPVQPLETWLPAKPRRILLPAFITTFRPQRGPSCHEAWLHARALRMWLCAVCARRWQILRVECRAT